MVVIYYTCPYYIDTAIETIKCLKSAVTLHVVIEVTPACQKSTLINLDDLSQFNELENPERVLGKEKWAQFEPYFKGAASVKFAIHANKRSFSLTSLGKSIRLGKYLKSLKADVIHFDTLTSRVIGLYPYVRRMRSFITVHDPLPHSGEWSWKEKLPNWLYLGWAKGFFFYSDFALKQFRDHFTSVKAPKWLIRFQPVTFLDYFSSKNKPEPQTILSFGRLSVYKGIDLLVEAIPAVLEKYPNEKFVIAGKPVPGFTVNEAIVEKYKNNIEIIPRFIEMDELVKFIEKSKFVVCPYRDATQSGVLMSAHAIGKMVLATNVGSFSEYIKHNVDGMLTEPDAVSLAKTIIAALDNDHYKRMEQKVTAGYSEEIGSSNCQIITDAYKKSLIK